MRCAEAEVVDRPPLLEARGVWKWLEPARKRPPALRNVSLTVPQAGFTLVTGPSGSGKTTLLSLLGGLDRPSEGRVFFEAAELGSMSDIALAWLRRRFGFVFQDLKELPGLPVWENVTYPLIPQGVSRRSRYARAAQVLARVGLEGFAEKPSDELSGGERQRAALARGIAGSPDVLIADEPTSNLDPDAAARVSALLGELNANGVTVVVASHDPLLAALATQIIMLREGTVVEITGANK